MKNGVIKYQNIRNGDIIYSSRFWEERTINDKVYIDGVRRDPFQFKNQDHFYMLKEALKEID